MFHVSLGYLVGTNDLSHERLSDTRARPLEFVILKILHLEKYVSNDIQEFSHKIIVSTWVNLFKVL